MSVGRHSIVASKNGGVVTTGGEVTVGGAPGEVAQKRVRWRGKWGGALGAPRDVQHEGAVVASPYFRTNTPLGAAPGAAWGCPRDSPNILRDSPWGSPRQVLEICFLT